jgi:DNA-binding transcriptional LysR family regulator
LAGYQQAPRGELSISCSPGFARFRLLPLVPRLLEQYPDLDLNLQTTGEKVDLLSHNIDVAIRLGKLQDSSLVARRLGESHRVICASPGYLATHGKPKKPADLTQHNCLTITTDREFNRWTLIRGKRQQVVTVSGNLVSNSLDSLYEMALEGLGIINLAEFIVADELRAGRLVPVLPGYMSDSQLIHAVYPHRRHLPAKVRVFVEFMIREMRTQPTWRK